MTKPLPLPRIKVKAPRPVESFGPEILAALLRGATEPLVLRMSYKMGVRFRLRIHQLREAMRRSGHDKYNLVARVRVEVKWPDDTPVVKSGRHWAPTDRDVMCRVVLRPNDTEFGALLAEAGVDIGLGKIDMPELEPEPLPISTLDDMLKDM